MKKDEEGKFTEYMNLDGFYEKLSNILSQDHSKQLTNQAQQNFKDLFQYIESLFARPISPYEIETLNQWIDVDKHDFTLIRAALDEAYSHDKLSFKYVDRILLNWKKNNVTTTEESKKIREQFNKPSMTHTVNHIPKFDWLNGEKLDDKKKALEMIDVIADMFPNAECELKHDNAFELTIAVLLSAQCTDNLVNKVTRTLFQKYKTPQDYLNVDIEELQNDIRSIGLYRNKAKNIQKLCQSLLEQFNGQIPSTHKELESLAGVGRKTANVVMSVAFDEPSLAVDTHVERVSKRLGINRWKDNVTQVEDRLCSIIPKERWSRSHHQLIFFGRYHCLARKPKCDICPLLDDCREGQNV